MAQPFSEKRKLAGTGPRQPREVSPLVISLHSDDDLVDDDLVAVAVSSGKKKPAPSAPSTEKKKRGLPLFGTSLPPLKRQILDDSARFATQFEAAPLLASHAGTGLDLFRLPSSSAAAIATAAAEPVAPQQAANQEAPSSRAVLLRRGLRDEVSRLKEELKESTGMPNQSTEKQQQQEKELLNLQQQVHELQQQLQDREQELVRSYQASQGPIVAIDDKIDKLDSQNAVEDLRGIKAELEKNETELQDVRADLADREEVIKSLSDMFDARAEMRQFNGGRSVSPQTELDVALMTNKHLENYVSDLTDQHEKKFAAQKGQHKQELAAQKEQNKQELDAQKEQHKQELAAEKAKYERRLLDQNVRFEGEKHLYILQVESQQAEAAKMRQDMEAARLAHSEDIRQLRSENQLLAEQKHQAEQQALQVKEQQRQAEEGRREAVSQHADDKAPWEARLSKANITIAQRNSKRLEERRLSLSQVEKERLVRDGKQFASENKKLAKDNAALTKKVTDLTNIVNSKTNKAMTKHIEGQILQARQGELQAQSERQELAARYDAIFARLVDALAHNSRLKDQLDECDVKIQ